MKRWFRFEIRNIYFAKPLYYSVRASDEDEARIEVKRRVDSQVVGITDYILVADEPPSENFN